MQIIIIKEKANHWICTHIVRFQGLFGKALLFAVAQRVSQSKTSSQNCAVVVIVDTTNNNELLATTPDAEKMLDVTSTHKPLTSPTGYSADLMTSLCSNAGALLWMHHSRMAATHSACAKVFPPPVQEPSISPHSAAFPFPVHSLPPIGFGQRRAVIHSWTTNSLPHLMGKEPINTTALSLVRQPFLSRLPWQPPLCCLLQPEIARRCRALVGGGAQLDRVNSCRVSPVNWLLSDDARVASSAHRDRVWNFSVDRRQASGAARQQSAVRDRDGERAPATPKNNCPPVTASISSAATGSVTGDRKLTCRHCGKPYASLGALKMHIRTHTLPCRCQLCGKAFSRPWLLQGHLRTHTGERPFACPQCGRAFADRSNLRAHLQTHAELKKYACDGCTKTFSRLSLLVKHRSGSAICGSASSSPWKP